MLLDPRKAVLSGHGLVPTHLNFWELWAEWGMCTDTCLMEAAKALYCTGPMGVCTRGSLLSLVDRSKAGSPCWLNAGTTLHSKQAPEI